AYSPSGQFLYVCNWNKLYQFDLLANDIPSSIELVGVFDGFGDPFPLLFFFMQETPDGRVFISTRNGSRYYHAIQEPNKKGLSCRFEQHTIQFPTYNNSTIPRFPNYRLGALGDPPCEGPVTSVIPDPGTEEGRLTIYPNPAADEVFVTAGQPVSEIRVFDARGVPVNISETDTDPVRISTVGWAPGLYFVLAGTASGQTYSSRVVKL